MKTRRNARTTSDPQAAIEVRSDDGAVSYRLRSSPHGLCVQRERRVPKTAARLMQTILFTESEDFIRWCEADSVRHDYPHLSMTVRREGGALLERYGRAPQPGGVDEGR